MSSTATPLPHDFNTADLIKQIPSVRIVSVAPKRMRTRMAVTRGYKEYVCEAATRGSYTFCDVGPEMIRMNAYNDLEPAGQRVEYESPVVRAAHLASRWSAPGFVPGLVTEGSWGVGVLSPGVLEPTTEFVAALVARTERLASDYVTHAGDLDRAGKANQIGDNHRCLASWLHGEAANKFTWFGRQSIVLTKDCPACATKINSRARRCAVCSTDLPQYYMDRPYLNVATEDPFIAEEIGKMKAATAKPQPAAEAADVKPPEPVRPIIRPPQNAPQQNRA